MKESRLPRLEVVLDSIERAGPYRLVYRLLLESGLGLNDVIRLIREHEMLKCVELDSFYRCLLKMKKGHMFWAYHITRVEPINSLTPHRVTSYAKRHQLVTVRDIRRFVTAKMLTLGIPTEAIDIIQGRIPSNPTHLHFIDVEILDNAYKRYAQWLKQVIAR